MDIKTDTVLLSFFKKHGLWGASIDWHTIAHIPPKDCISLEAIKAPIKKRIQKLIAELQEIQDQL